MKYTKMLSRSAVSFSFTLRRVALSNKYFRLSSTTTYDTNHTESTHFGFQNVLEEEKQDKVDAVFENVAQKYDVMNDAMSVGIHRLWKDYFMEQLAPPPGTKLLDVAGGTGDIAFRFLKYVQNEISRGSDTSKYEVSIPDDVTRHIYGTTDDSEVDTNLETLKPQSHVTVCDINQAMLDVGKAKAQKYNLHSGISWLQGNAECLPIADNTYDAYTIAYGIRNVTHIDKVLSEAYRVLKHGGRFMCLEFSQVPNPVLRKVYDEYSFQVIPVLGQLIAADWHSYQYLVESIRQFPPQDEFAGMIRDAGFKLVTYENLTFGVTAIHSGFKL